jgi:hypothetical protein
MPRRVAPTLSSSKNRRVQSSTSGVSTRFRPALYRENMQIANQMRWPWRTPARPKRSLVLNIVIKAVMRGGSDWSTVATGTWAPGEGPQLSHKSLPSSLVRDLCSAVDASVESGKTTAEYREFSYSMEWSS